MAIRLWGTLLIVALALGGCGDDSDGAAKDAGPDSGGASGKSGSGGKGGTGGSPPARVMCGAMICPTPADPTAMLPPGIAPGPTAAPAACCFDQSTEVCGITTEGSDVCEEYAVADERCPSIIVPELIKGLVGEVGFGCCAPNNRCGVEGAAFGRGCVPNEEAAENLMGLPIMIPDPQDCDAVTDGGADDGGA